MATFDCTSFLMALICWAGMTSACGSATTVVFVVVSLMSWSAGSSLIARSRIVLCTKKPLAAALRYPGVTLLVFSFYCGYPPNIRFDAYSSRFVDAAAWKAEVCPPPIVPADSVGFIRVGSATAS